MSDRYLLLSKATLKASSALMGVPLVRKIAMNFGDRAVGKNIEEGRRPFSPPQVMADQKQIVHNLFKALDRWLARPEVTRPQRERMLLLISKIWKGSGREVKQKFKETYGMNPPAFLTLSPSKRCNLKCTGCYASSAADTTASLDFDVVDRIVREQEDLWASHFTVISGGEPLMYRSQGKGILHLAARHPDTFFLMYTNGTLIDEQVADTMARLGNITPAISVEGYDRETDERRGEGTHGRILQAFQNLRKAGVPYGISVTATKNNCETILSPDFVDYYFRHHGASYMWIFQYMPIGRGYTLELLVSPEQRLAMFRRTQDLIHRRELFVADFWNSATLSNGCVSAGKEGGGGYVYVDWNGNVMPCVFNPYTTQNIKDVFGAGGNLNETLMSSFMKRIREWQEDYLDDAGGGSYHNILVPCPIRDHHGDMRKIIDETGAKPADEAAEEALKDESYYQGMCNYGAAVEASTRELWSREYSGVAEKE